MRSLLEIDNLEYVYQKSILAISGVSLSVRKRQIVALLRTNGAGKTTILRCVMGKGLDGWREWGRKIADGERRRKY